MRPLVIRVIAVAVVMAGLCFTCLVQVNETEYAIVARFGDPRRVIERAGLYWKWPAPMDTVIRIDRRIHILDPDAAEYLTSDKKNVLVNGFVVWSVGDPIRYL
ncbi:SPFH domain-containing protein, partial [Candidatus Entotheonella palauensis]